MKLPTRLLFATLLLAVSGCSIIPAPTEDPTRFYVLAGTSNRSGGPAKPTGTTTVGLRSIELSPYLRTRSLIVRDGRNEIEYQDYARWAEPLELGLARVMRSQLTQAPAVARVLSYPFPFDQKRDFDVAINLVRCEGVRENGNWVARFEAVIELIAVSDGSIVTRQVFAAPDRPWDGRNHDSLVAALSESSLALGQAVIAILPSAP